MLISINIKKEDLINLKDNVHIEMSDNLIKANIVLDAYKAVRLPDVDGWKTYDLQDIESKVCLTKY